MKQFAFIFDYVCISPERQIGIHSHSRWELSYVVCGAGTRTIGDMTEPFAQDEIILIPPDIPHVWRFDPSVTDAAGNIANISVFFDSALIVSLRDIIPEIAAPLERLGALDHAVSYQAERYRAVRRLLMQMRGKTPEKRLPLMMDLLVEMSDISESVCRGKNSSITSTEQRLEKVRVYCACNYAGDISLDEISRHVGMNKSAFCTFMRHNAGMTFSEYLNSMRLERAWDKLRHTDRAIAEIAMICGFQNVTYFNRLFRRKYGCTPKKVRKVASE